MPGFLATMNVNEQVEVIYTGYFNRAADAGGFAFWNLQNAKAQMSVASGGLGQTTSIALTNIANSFAPINQAESRLLYPFLATATLSSSDPLQVTSMGSFLDTVYSNLFGHTADIGGKSYWSNAIFTGQVELGAAILAIADGATGNDAATLANKAVVALDFTTRTAAAGLGSASPLSAAFLAEAKAVVSGVTGEAASVIAQESETSRFVALSDGRSGGPNTLIISAATANAQTSSAVPLINTDVKILGVDAGFGGTIVDYTKLGSSIDTIKLYGLAAASVSVTNAPESFTYDEVGVIASTTAGFQNNKDLSVSAATSPNIGISVFNFTANNQSGGGNYNNISITGYETVNSIISGSATETFNSVLVIPISGKVTNLNIIDNDLNNTGLAITGPTNVGLGTIVLTGASPGSVTFGGSVTSSLLDGSGLGSILSGSAGIVMSANSGSLISISGTGGNDILIGSGLGHDVINGGGGNDTIINHLSTGVSVTSGASLSGGFGADSFVLRGDSANADNYNGAPNITDFTATASPLTSDVIRFSAIDTDYTKALWKGGGSDISSGDFAMLAVIQPNVAGQIAGVGQDIFKLSSPVPFAKDIQNTFNNAIGTATVDLGGAAHEYVFLVYDTTHNVEFILGVESDGAGKVGAGSTVHLIGTATLANGVSDFNALSSAQFGAFI